MKCFVVSHRCKQFVSPLEYSGAKSSSSDPLRHVATKTWPPPKVTTVMTSKPLAINRCTRRWGQCSARLRQHPRQWLRELRWGLPIYTRYNIGTRGCTTPTCSSNIGPPGGVFRNIIVRVNAQGCDTFSRADISETGRVSIT